MTLGPSVPRVVGIYLRLRSSSTSTTWYVQSGLRHRTQHDSRAAAWLMAVEHTPATNIYATTAVRRSGGELLFSESDAYAPIVPSPPFPVPFSSPPCPLPTPVFPLFSPSLTSFPCHLLPMLPSLLSFPLPLASSLVHIPLSLKSS